MAGNRGVAYVGPGKVEVQEIPYPKLELQKLVYLDYASFASATTA